MLEAMTIKEESGKCFLSPYDDPAVIAGQVREKIIAPY
jgi:threonine dehydratase